MNSRTAEELSVAASSSLCGLGNRDAAALVKEISESPAEKSQELKKLSSKLQSGNSLPYSDDERFALYVDDRFSKEGQNSIHKGAKSRNVNLYLLLSRIPGAKGRYYSGKETILISETTAGSSLQGIVNHTI